MDDELDSFRRQWEAEVRQRATGQSSGLAPASSAGDEPSHAPRARSPQSSKQASSQAPKQTAPFSPGTKPPPAQESQEIVYHDLPNPEDGHRLRDGPRPTDSAPEHPKPPETALEHFEQAVECESQGKMMDSVNLYRKAFKMDERVHEAFRAKHYGPLGAHKQRVREAHERERKEEERHQASRKPDSSVPNMVESFAMCTIDAREPETDLETKKPCFMAKLPEEILLQILEIVAVEDVAKFTKLASVCKKLAWLVASENQIWRRVLFNSKFGIQHMPYYYKTDRLGKPLNNLILPLSRVSTDLTPSQYPTYRRQFRQRPRIRFNGCYISTVNYTRPGQSHQSHYNWFSPVLIVTYYRYLRFFRDGTVISLLTTTEPVNVVYHLHKEHLHKNHKGNLPSAVMKDAHRGRWRLSGTCPEQAKHIINKETEFLAGPGTYTREHQLSHEGEIDETEANMTHALDNETEDEGDLHIETESPAPKYTYKMHMSLGNTGRRNGPRNTKLSWQGYWMYNNFTSDWARFELKHDRPFYFSRVRGYDEVQVEHERNFSDGNEISGFD